MHLVKWDVVTRNKSFGGLGVRRINIMNACLLLKWWWRFGTENHSLWKAVICNKYNLRGGSWTPSSSRNGSEIWSDI